MEIGSDPFNFLVNRGPFGPLSGIVIVDTVADRKRIPIVSRMPMNWVRAIPSTRFLSRNPTRIGLNNRKKFGYPNLWQLYLSQPYRWHIVNCFVSAEQRR